MAAIKETRSTILLTIVFVLLWNSGFIGAEYGLPYAGAFTLLFWRYWALTLILLIYLLLRKRLKWAGLRTIGYAFFIGTLAHGFWLACVLVSMQRGVPSGIVALIVALQPMVTGTFSGLVVGEYLRPSQWWGLLIGFLGVALAVVPRTDFTNVESIFSYLLPLGSVIAITIATLVERKAQTSGQAYRLPVDTSLFYQSLATAITITIPAVFFEGLATQWTPKFLGTMVWLIFVISLSAYGLMWILLRRIDATRVASLFYLGPPVTMLMAWAVLGEVPQPMDYVGLVVVAIGVLLVQR